MIYGYDSLVSDFKRLKERGDLSHAYLLFGEAQVGKFLFAKSFAHYLEGGEFCEGTKLLQDALIVDLSSDEKEGGEKESLGIARVREIEHFLHRTPAQSEYRTVILNNAEWLTVQAQNALLKILEEPPRHSLVIAIAKDISVFLPTVNSRFQKIYFATLPDNKVLDFINEYGTIEKSRVPSILTQSVGRIGRTWNLLNKKENKKEQRVRALARIAASGTFSLRNVVDELFELLSDIRLADFFFEELVLDLRNRKRYEALKEVCRILFLSRAFNLSRRAYLSYLLWTTKSSSRRFSSSLRRG